MLSQNQAKFGLSLKKRGRECYNTRFILSVRFDTIEIKCTYLVIQSILLKFNKIKNLKASKHENCKVFIKPYKNYTYVSKRHKYSLYSGEHIKLRPGFLYISI